MPERLMTEGFQSFIGKHCETTALKRVLDYHRLSLSEEMLFGLGGGVGFIYWYMKSMPGPFIGGRGGKVVEFAENICRRIGAEATVVETSSARRGYEAFKALLGNQAAQRESRRVYRLSAREVAGGEFYLGRSRG